MQKKSKILLIELYVIISIIIFITPAQSSVSGTVPEIYIIDPTSPDVYGSTIALRWQFYNNSATINSSDTVINFTLTDPEGNLAINEKNMAISELSTSYTYAIPDGKNIAGTKFDFIFSIYYVKTGQLYHYSLPVEFTWVGTASSGNITTYIIVAVVIIGLVFIYYYYSKKKDIKPFSFMQGQSQPYYNEPSQPYYNQPYYTQPQPQYQQPYYNQPQYQPQPQYQQPYQQPQYQPIPIEKPRPTKLSKECGNIDEVLNNPKCKKEYIDIWGNERYNSFESEQRPIWEEEQKEIKKRELSKRNIENISR